jgi:flavin-dependent dehydrogenase
MANQFEYDAVVIGGGPAGSTVATLLAKAGRRVVVLERDSFPRFHIGESLLAASNLIFDRLGVHEAIRKQFIRKGGGKFLYGPDPVRGDFSNPDRHACFAGSGNGYMVERSRFDKLLIDQSASCGADVRFQHKVTSLIRDGERVVGVCAEDEHGEKAEFTGKMVFDCSGLGAFIGNHLKIRRANPEKRCAIYAHYKARAVDEDIKEGWIVAQMFPNGWTWIIPLAEDLMSVGVVLLTDVYRNAGSSPESKGADETPEDYLERMIHSKGLLDGGMSPDATRVSDVRVNGNVGYTCDRFVGDGWILVGDAAYFIDPCYSSGVHLALSSAELAADTFLKCHCSGDSSHFQKYEKKLRWHQKTVTKMVDAFYIASWNPLVRRVIVFGHNFSKRGTRKFVTFAGGDFSKNTSFISSIYWTSRVLDFVFPFRDSKARNGSKAKNTPKQVERSPATKSESALTEKTTA